MVLHLPSGNGCAKCHEMATYVDAMHGSPHRNAGCMDCHTASLATKLRHIRVHLAGSWPEAIRLRDVDVLEMVPNCEKCHRHEYATWHAGPHSATYGEIFTNPKQNSKQHLMNDCLRCHGMHFDGSIRDMVQPQNTQGPWHLTRTEFADQPAMPCQTCHWITGQASLKRGLPSEGRWRVRPSTIGSPSMTGVRACTLLLRRSPFFGCTMARGGEE